MSSVLLIDYRFIGDGLVIGAGSLPLMEKDMLMVT